MLFSLACFITAGVCLIVDSAINRQVSWSIFPLMSIAFGFLVLSPLLLKKHGLLISMGAASLLAAPYLYLMNLITPGGDWFRPVGLPCAVIGIIALWVFYCLFRFVKINLWYQLAIDFFLSLVIVSPAIDYFISRYLNAPTDWLSLIIHVFAGITASILFAVMGYAKNHKNKAARGNQQ